MSKLKIVHLITGLNVGGAEMMLFKLLSGMDQCRFDNVVVSLIEAGPIGKKIEELGVPVYSLGMRRSPSSVIGMIKLLCLLAHERTCILQAWMYHANLLGLIVGRIAGVRHITWNVRSSHHDPAHYHPASIWIFRACAHLSGWPNTVVVNSETGRLIHQAQGYHPRYWTFIPNGFDLDHFRPNPAARQIVRDQLDICPHTVLIGLVGRYHPMKDHRTFLRAAMLMAERDPNVHFLLVGRNVLPTNVELMELIVQYKIEDRVSLLGEQADIPKLMAAVDILASSSFSGEGFPNVIGEAMACEVPCAVTDVGDSAAIVGNTGVVVPPGQPEAMARALESLIDAGTARRRALGKLARERIRQNYSIEHIVRTYEELYESLGRT
jgi:glycosyltransferase involved in cell wall biosynthesis